MICAHKQFIIACIQVFKSVKLTLVLTDPDFFNGKAPAK